MKRELLALGPVNLVVVGVLEGVAGVEIESEDVSDAVDKLGVEVRESSAIFRRHFQFDPC